MRKNLPANTRSNVTVALGMTCTESMDFVQTEQQTRHVGSEFIIDVPINESQEVKLVEGALTKEFVPSKSDSQATGDVIQRVHVTITETALCVALTEAVSRVPAMQASLE